ncbi:MAG: hypothetical protein KAJ73_01075 [Zetaproteobacteria bacterium]|nr:hypothetical protein [Zetaproteobacteria bacterium]
MTSKALREVLIALQGAAGTPDTVDVALHATCSLKPNVTKIHPEEDIGSHAPERHYVAQIMPEGNLTFENATYEEIVYPIAMALGEETPSGGGDPYTWAWVLPDATSPTMVLFTLEYSDGGTYITRGEAIFAKSLTISGEAAQGWSVEAELTGGEVDLPDNESANPTPLATATPITMAATLLKVDAAWANVGDTTVEELISFNWKLEDLLHEKQFAGSLFPNSRGSAKWKTTLELVLEVAAAEAQTFADAVLTTTQYAVRIAGYIDANDSCNIDGMYMVESVDPLDDRDGNNTIKITLLGEKDASDNTGGITVVTNHAAL